MMSHRGFRRLRAGALAALGTLVLIFSGLAPAAPAAALPTGFRDTVVISGRTSPTAIRFAPDGSIFVAEKSGKIWKYTGLTDTAPSLFADLSSKVDNYWDRGLLGIALPPDFPTGDDGVYVLYSYDAPIGGTAPVWNDACPTPPGATTDGCVISGRLSKLSGGAGATSTSETVLVNNWCQQFPSHSMGTALFGADGYLYVSAGDGASFNNVDYGQYGGSYSGDKANPCADPPGTAGTALTAPTAEGGALRAQSARRTDGPAVLNGAVLRLTRTGAAAPGNPFSTTDANKARVLAYGLRNPFRMTVRPGTNELWVGDVGWNTWEEIDRITSTTSGAATNFGWPCYEGAAQQPDYHNAGLNLCNSLYTSGGTAAPYYAFQHGVQLTGSTCSTTNGSAITGLAFHTGTGYPTGYDGALFFADHSRNCVWAMRVGSDGLPDPSSIVDFQSGGNPVDVETGPASLNNDIFTVDMEGGSIHRLTYTSATNVAPTAAFTATPSSGNAPLPVQFDASASTDPEGGALAYAWDFGDGATGTGRTASHSYTTNGSYTAKLTVTDPGGLTDSATRKISVGITATVTVTVKDRDSHATLSTYKEGDTIAFSGAATLANGSAAPASDYSWDIEQHHCDSATSCHIHVLQTISGITSGSFVPPDHDYPSYVTVKLTVSDPGTGSSASPAPVRVDPTTVNLTFKTNPGGLHVQITADSTSAAITQVTPFTKTFIVRHQIGLLAPTTQTSGGRTYTWKSWSDGLPASHTVIAPASATTYTATYRQK